MKIAAAVVLLYLQCLKWRSRATATVDDELLHERGELSYQPVDGKEEVVFYAI